MATKIDSTTQKSFQDIQQQVTKLDAQAKKEKSVKSDQFNDVLKNLDSIDKSKLDQGGQDRLQNLTNEVKMMQMITTDTSNTGSEINNASWSQGFADINKMLADFGVTDGSISGVVGGHGPGTAYKNLSAEDAKTMGLPDAVAKLQDPGAPGGAQQVNKFTTKDKEDFFVASDNSSPPNYSVYNKDGANLGSMKAPAALGLNDGSGNWLVASKDGIAGSWNTNDLKSLPQDTQLFDINGALQDKMKSLGSNSGGTAAAAQGGAKKTAFENGPDGKPGAEGGRTKGPYSFATYDKHNWVGVTNDGQKPVYADLYSNPHSSSDAVKLKDADGRDVTPSGLKYGGKGEYKFSDGVRYVSNDNGKFMINGDKAINLADRTEISADDATKTK